MPACEREIAHDIKQSRDIFQLETMHMQSFYLCYGKFFTHDMPRKLISLHDMFFSSQNILGESWHSDIFAFQ